MSNFDLLFLNFCLDIKDILYITCNLFIRITKKIEKILKLIQINIEQIEFE